VKDLLLADLSWVNHQGFGGSQYWLLIQDEFTQYEWSFFLKSKSHLPDYLIPWLIQLQKDQHLKIHISDVIILGKTSLSMNQSEKK
jgi:hypothetical protein